MEVKLTATGIANDYPKLLRFNSSLIFRHAFGLLIHAMFVLRT